MFPDQPNQNGEQPTPQPQQPVTQPTYGVNSAPQVAANGQYEVVPPPSVTGNHSGHNPYEFIVNPNKPKKSGGLFGGSSFVKQIAVILGGAVLLMVAAALVISALAPKKDSSASLTAIAQRQQEIIRVATVGATQATGQSAKNFTTNVELGVSSSQVQVLAYAHTKGTKISPKLLALDRSAQTDKLLADAAATSTLDSAVTQNLTSQLTTYETSLRTAYKQSSSSKAKQILQSSYNTAALLLEQAKQDTTSRP